MVSPIRYRGHGRYEAYYPGLSIAGVLGHELIHMASYRRRAAQEGQLILQGGIRLHLSFRDGHLVATGGEAYVRTLPLRAPAAAASPQSPGPGPQAQPAVPPAPVPPGPTDSSTPVPPESGPGGFSATDPGAAEAQLRQERQRIDQLLWQLRARERTLSVNPAIPNHHPRNRLQRTRWTAWSGFWPCSVSPNRCPPRKPRRPFWPWPARPIGPPR